MNLSIFNESFRWQAHLLFARIAPRSLSLMKFCCEQFTHARRWGRGRGIAKMTDRRGDEEKAPLRLLNSTSSTLSLQYSGQVQNRSEQDDGRIKVYRWRWVVLAIVVSVMSVNFALWVAFGPIADVVQCYYDTTTFWVNSASMVFMLTYSLFLVPSAWLLGRVGLRTTLIIAASMNAVGSCLRVAGAGKEQTIIRISARVRIYSAGPIAGSFWVMLSGQTIASFCNLLLSGAPAYLAGIWFPASERGTAAAMFGALAPQVYPSYQLRHNVLFRAVLYWRVQDHLIIAMLKSLPCCSWGFYPAMSLVLSWYTVMIPTLCVEEMLPLIPSYTTSGLIPYTTRWSTTHLCLLGYHSFFSFFL